MPLSGLQGVDISTELNDTAAMTTKSVISFEYLVCPGPSRVVNMGARCISLCLIVYIRQYITHQQTLLLFLDYKN